MHAAAPPAAVPAVEGRMVAGGTLMGCGPASAAVALQTAPVDESGGADGRLGGDNLADDEGRIVHEMIAAVRAEEDGDV